MKTPKEWATELRDRGYVDAERTIAEAIADERERCTREIQKRVREAVNEECECGGLGPNDSGVCTACCIWHRVYTKS